MKIIAKIWFIILIINAVLALFKMMNIKATKIEFSHYPKVFVLQFFIVFNIVLVAKIIDGFNLVGFFPHGLLLHLFSLYTVYVVFRFQYKYDGDIFYWFNGLYSQSIKAVEVEKVIVKKSKGVIQKSIFILSGKTVKLSNNLGAFIVISEFCIKNNIQIQYQKT